MVQLTVRDETTAGEKTGEFVMDLLAERITVRELIRSRVYQEVQDYNLKTPEYFRGLVEPADAKKTLNGIKIKKGRQLDWRKQLEVALEAFQANRILILVNERQVENLDEEIVVEPETQVSFLRLVPLIGG
jgi:hypothetical protein